MSLVSSNCQRNTLQDHGIPRQSFRKCLRTQLHVRTPLRLVAQRLRQFGTAYQKMGHMERLGPECRSLWPETPYASHGGMESFA
jgi:hypothetical protein